MDEIMGDIISAAIWVHCALGPGLALNFNGTVLRKGIGRKALGREEQSNRSGISASPASLRSTTGTINAN